MRYLTNPDHSPYWPVPAMSVEIRFVTEARDKEGGTLEYAFGPVKRILQRCNKRESP